MEGGTGAYVRLDDFITSQFELLLFTALYKFFEIWARSRAWPT